MFGAAILGGALTACTSAPAEADILRYIDGFEMLSPSQSVELIEYHVADGWDDGVEYIVRYRICDGEGGSARSDCREKNIGASFALMDGEWRPIYRPSNAADVPPP